jgi:hypothetical protein
MEGLAYCRSDVDSKSGPDLWTCRVSSPPALGNTLTRSLWVFYEGIVYKQIKLVPGASDNAMPPSTLASTTSHSQGFPTTNTDPSSQAPGTQNISKGAIAGIVVGVMTALLLALATLLFMRRRKQQRQVISAKSATSFFNWSALPELVSTRGAKGSSNAEMSMAHPNDDVSGPMLPGTAREE